MALFAGTIEKRVMAVLKQKIADAEKEHQETSSKIDADIDLQMEQLEVSRENRKRDNADAIVNVLVGKFI